MFNTKFLKTLNESNDSSLYLTYMFSYKHNSYPVDTGRKLNVHKTFKRRPGRLLNILRTFSLRPVSKGYKPIQAYIPSFFPSQ